ncbi:MAG: YggT family protein [Candidatus Omnitrophica bacterium]|nr:YggT family protein [Candidatus Omnitrophota bacterium]
MFILGNLFIAFSQIIDIILTIAYWLILIRALISWVNPDPDNDIVRMLYRTTEPILQPIRRVLPMLAVDISPIIAFLAIMFLRSFLVQTLLELGLRFK